jgi:phosphohistidine phosphatase
MTEHVSRRLVLVRHAKSDWPEVYDHERPLAARGRRTAPAVGTWLRTHDLVPDLVVCSTARRARETWDLVAGTLGGAVEVRFDEQVYDADVPELLEVVHDLPDTAATVLLVGHNPGFHELALTLAGTGEGDALERLRGKFPTAAVAVLSHAGPWPVLDVGVAVLAEFAVPR